MMKLKGNPVPDHVETLGDDAIGFYTSHGHAIHAKAARAGLATLLREFRRWRARRAMA